jgi:predicted flap endonuclease-1-like 5' DNA nuclease
MALERPVEGAPDDLTLIGGIGPKIQEVLNSLGIWHFDQIAAWTPENIAWVDAYLSFAGRIVREGWVEQARVLAGETAGT